MPHQTLRFKITGESPLLMHNGQLADPLNKWSKAIKAISGKRKKTDADLEEMARLEWYGSLYLDNGKPCIPGEVLEATVVNAAKKSRQGVQVKMGAFCPGNYPLSFKDEADTLDALWEGNNHRLTVGVKLGTGHTTVMRTRPRFEGWSANCELVFDDEVMSEGDIWQILEVAGRYVGLMDWRPRYGRFTIKKLNGKK